MKHADSGFRNKMGDVGNEGLLSGLRFKKLSRFNIFQFKVLVLEAFDVIPLSRSLRAYNQKASPLHDCLRRGKSAC